ncbi:hypothetical protein [Bradyrhizobium japonicum]|uniref:hypothetical protein n=1 Tax=Bradyrhizobium japonicum TaxID=375 RepID=UPI001BA6FD90|nr:hypothetical protein [Bradyrhizobium japonicum]MBR0959472.1 hypothetical protein [Bradyrhizobium japonicum]
MSKEHSDANKGIIAGSVRSEVIAVGDNATAVQHRSSVDVQQFRSSVSELRGALDGLRLPESTRTALSEHVSQLEHEAENPTPDRSRVEGALKALSSSVKMLGEFVSNASIILGPIAKIAGLFGITLL